MPIAIFTRTRRETTGRIAEHVRISYPLALALARELGVRKVDGAYAWTWRDYMRLHKLLAADKRGRARPDDDDE